jgi:hypothetical protein
LNQQIEILESLTGKYLTNIVCQRIKHKPFPIVNNEYLIYGKFGLMFSGDHSTWEYEYTIEGLIKDYKNHHNPFKLKINKESILVPVSGTSSKIKEAYKSFFDIGFKIGSVYIYEDDLRWNTIPDFEFIKEVKEKETLGSTIVLNDESGLRNILISCYEMPSEQMEIEMKIKFQFSNIFTEHNIENNGKRKFIAKVGTSPEER